MENIRFYMPNPDALRLLDPKLVSSPAFTVSAEDLRRCEVIRDVGECEALYRKVWERIKSE